MLTPFLQILQFMSVLKRLSKRFEHNCICAEKKKKKPVVSSVWIQRELCEVSKLACSDVSYMLKFRSTIFLFIFFEGETERLCSSSPLELKASVYTVHLTLTPFMS